MKFKEGDIVHPNNMHINYPHTFVAESKDYFIIRDESHLLDMIDDGFRVVPKETGILSKQEYTEYRVKYEAKEKEASILHHERALKRLKGE